MNEKLYRSAKDVNNNHNFNLNESFSNTVILTVAIISLAWVLSTGIKAFSRREEKPIIIYNNKEKKED